MYKEERHTRGDRACMPCGTEENDSMPGEVSQHRTEEGSPHTPPLSHVRICCRSIDLIILVINPTHSTLVVQRTVHSVTRVATSLACLKYVHNSRSRRYPPPQKKINTRSKITANRGELQPPSTTIPYCALFDTIRPPLVYTLNTPPLSPLRPSRTN